MSTPATDLQPTLDALRRLRRGEDPRGRLLDDLLARTGAGLAAWIPAGEGSGVLVRRRGRAGDAPTTAELPRQLPWPVLLDLAPESSRRLDAAWLRRWPSAAALGSTEALAGRAAGGGRLWLESTSPIPLRQADFRAWLEGLAEFEQLELARLERRRAETLVRRGAAAAGVAHDLRNQLSLAALEFDRLRELGELGDGEQLARTLREARSLSQSFLTHNGSALATKPLRGLLESELRAATELAARPGVGARLKCPRGLATAVDEVLLRRVLRNLLLNALHATSDGGAVRLSAGAADDARIDVVVEDDGRGMDERQLERWMRAGASGRGSTGFGTTSVLDCVKELGAELAIDSELGEGTRCVVRLPRAEAGDRAGVLVCDPDGLRRARVVRLVEAFGVRAVGCADAPRARAILDQHGARGLLIARGDRGHDSLALRAVARASGLRVVELSVLADERRVVGELCATLREAPPRD